MPVVLLGLNQKTAPVEVRERFNYSEDQLPGVLQEMRQRQGIDEIAVISTCNRTELYAVTQEPSLCRSSLLTLFSGSGHPDFLYMQNDLDAVKHLFEVSSGLDSLVVGENQILGQVDRKSVV